MNKKKTTYSIRGKLVSAACMLLVAVIMVVSSTYAWFTLSTAPEVSGIQTAIGANGALEMALFTGDEPKDGVVNTTDWLTKNQYWGNLVDLSDGYGLNTITLYPSVLNLEQDGKTLGAAALKVPVYGSDGRVSGLSTNTTTGLWEAASQTFKPGTGFGVRGVGSASGMTPRQLAYRNARSEAATAASLALTMAAQSLNLNGSALANIAIAHGLGNDNAYTQADVDTLGTIIEDLNNISAQIETAYMQYILAFAASAAVTNENAWNLVSGAIEEEGATLESVTTALGVALPEQLSTAIAKYNAMLDSVEEATTKFESIATKETYTWSDISGAMTPLVNVSAIQVNGIEAGGIKDKMDALVDSVLEKGGITVSMATGGGVYADIADQCGNFSASITIAEVSYGGMTLKNMTAKMNTASTVTPAYLNLIGTVVTAAGAPAAEANADMPITEFYGYILDLAFRTNAAESNLLLQTQGVDRIYNDNANEETMGGGSTMTFAATDTNFTIAQVKALMKNLRVVFFTPDTTGATIGTVLKYAKLDMTQAKEVLDENGNPAVEAPLYLYEVVTTTVTTYTDGTTTYYECDGKYYTDAACQTPVAEGFDSSTLTKGESTTTTTEKMYNAEGDDCSIVALPQNTSVKVSALVYLDGETITNKDVSATQAKSLTGKMNLQFSSSATLTPMEYADLHQKPASSN